MESKSSPLSESEKKEWRADTNFSKLPEKLHNHINEKMHEPLHGSKARKSDATAKDNKVAKEKVTHSKTPAAEPPSSSKNRTNFIHGISAAIIDARRKKTQR